MCLAQNHRQPGAERLKYLPVSSENADAFPTLRAPDIALVLNHGTRRPIEVGEYLFHQGDETYEFYVVLSGAVEVIVHADGTDRVITRHGPGRFVGELNLVTGLRLFVSARVVERGEVVVVSREGLQQILATEPSLSDTILKALIARRALLLESAAASLRLVGSRFSPDTRRIREYLTRSRIPHEWLNPDEDASVEALLQTAGHRSQRSAGRLHRRDCSAPRDTRVAGGISRIDRRQPAQPHLRPGDRRQRSRRTRRGGVWRLRRAGYSDPG
jgi:thioredoxin reductase (NADPH)